jgi:hypothetical protein
MCQEEDRPDPGAGYEKEMKVLADEFLERFKALLPEELRGQVKDGMFKVGTVWGKPFPLTGVTDPATCAKMEVEPPRRKTWTYTG